MKILQRRTLITSCPRHGTPAAKEEPLPAPLPDGAPKVYSEKLVRLVDDISKLTLSEVVSLSDLLKVLQQSFFDQLIG